MGLLAYDPDRVAHLQHHLAAAVDELRAFRSNDPAAIDAIHAVATVRNDVEQVWLPLLARILDNTALTRDWWYAATRADNLQNALINVMADGYGWTVHHDPLSDDATTVTLAEARALGATLNTADLLRLTQDRSQLRWLAQQLQIIGRDHALSAQFLANFNSWQTVTRVLGLEYARTERPDVAAVFDGLMKTWRTTVPPAALTAGKSARLNALLPEIDELDPYVQALMVRSLQLDALTVATVANELLTNWLAKKSNPSAPVTIDRLVGPGSNAADLLLPLLLVDPAACTWFTELATHQPPILFETLNDPDLAYQVVLVGTDPGHSDTATAGRAVLAILDYFRSDPYQRPGFDNDGHPGEYGLFLGDLVAPWLVQFTMSNHDWDASAGEKAAALRVALHEEQAMQQLIANAEQIRVGFIASLATPDSAAALQVGALLNLLLQLSVNERVDDEIARTDDRINLLWTVVGAASNFLPGGPFVGIATGFALTALSNQLGKYLDQPDASRVRHTAERAMDVALALAGADAVARLHQQWIADGLIAASHPGPPAVVVAGDETWCRSAEYHNTFSAWRAGLPGGVTGTLSRQAGDLLAVFIGASEAQSNCAEIAG